MKSSSDARVKPKACSGAPGDARPEVQNQLDADVCPNLDELRARLLAHWRDVERRAVALPQIVLSRGPAMSLHQVTGGVDWRAVRAIAASREDRKVRSPRAGQIAVVLGLPRAGRVTARAGNGNGLALTALLVMIHHQSRDDLDVAIGVSLLTGLLHPGSKPLASSLLLQSFQLGSVSLLLLLESDVVIVQLALVALRLFKRLSLASLLTGHDFPPSSGLRAFSAVVRKPRRRNSKIRDRVRPAD